MHGQEPRIGLSPRPALKTSSKTPGASNLQVNMVSVTDSDTVGN